MAIVSVVGMHRSGTSCLAGALQEAGLYGGDVSRGDPYNARGNREHREIRGLNDDVLVTSGGDWSRPPDRVLWREEHERRRDRLVARFARAARHWTFKDPRTLLVLPFWKAAPGAVVFVGIFRHPVNVARSLGARGAMSLPPDLAIPLWIGYNRRLLGLFRCESFPLVCFDASPTRVVDALAGSVEWLNHRLQPDLPLRPEAARAFYELGLVHQTDADPRALLSSVKAEMRETPALAEAVNLYDELRALANAGRAGVA
jgi:hypothetical protein